VIVKYSASQKVLGDWWTCDKTRSKDSEAKHKLKSYLFLIEVKYGLVALGGVKVSMLPIGSKVRGFKPGRERWIFKGDKNPQHAFLPRRSKAVGPIS
jgi:hypothetical protein